MISLSLLSRQFFIFIDNIFHTLFCLFLSFRYDTPMYEKFLIWIERKFALHNRKNIPSFRERDIFWSSLGENIGSEENGKWSEYTRPVLIVRKFNKQIFLNIRSTIFKNFTLTDEDEGVATNVDL